MSEPTTSSGNAASSLIDRLTRGEISRRAFIEGATALGVSLVAATTLLSKAEAATPRKGGRLRAGLDGGSTTDTLDPATFEDTFIISFSWALRNCLTEIDTQGQLVPELAENWEGSDDATQWTFELRQGVELHNVKSVDADDVVA